MGRQPLIVVLPGIALRRVRADVSGQAVWARLRGAEGAGPWVTTALTWDSVSRGFAGELPGQSPGLYEVQIRARRMPTAGDLETADTMAVVEGG